MVGEGSFLKGWKFSIFENIIAGMTAETHEGQEYVSPPGIVNTPLSPFYTYRLFSDGLISVNEYGAMMKHEIGLAAGEYRRRVRAGTKPDVLYHSKDALGENLMSWRADSLRGLTISFEQTFTHGEEFASGASASIQYDKLGEIELTAKRYSYDEDMSEWEDVKIVIAKNGDMNHEYKSTRVDDNKSDQSATRQHEFTYSGKIKSSDGSGNSKKEL